MPVFIAALLGGLIQAAGTLVGRVLLSLGLGLVVFSGLDTGLDWFRDQAFARLDAGAAALPALGSFLGVLQVGSCINIIASALAARMLVRGLSSGLVKRWVTK